MFQEELEMYDVQIRRPLLKDIQQLNDFFEFVITDTFIKEGIGNKLDHIQKEMECKKKYLKADFESNGKKRYFLIAFIEDRIIGSIEFGPVSELIKSCTNNAYCYLNEVGTVFVYPEYQGNGIGNMLLQAMYKTLRSKGIDEFCLDCGYKNAQKIWQNKFGKPDYHFKDYWDKGQDHMIWRIKLRDCMFD